MKLAISNLAWNPNEDQEIIATLKSLGVTAVELAPTKTWPDLAHVTESSARAERERWEQQGLSVCALQSLLFGRTDLVIFGADAQRELTKQFLKHVISIAGWLGAGALVFGSPKNRARGAMDTAQAIAIAVPFFRELGDHAANVGTKFCIEPNPSIYGCDFILTADEGAELVRRVDSPGFRLHLDSAGMFLSGDDSVAAINAHAALLSHFHISAPQLAPVNSASPIDYRSLVTALRDINYPGWISIEMKQDPVGGNAATVKEALRCMQKLCAPM